jgi:hypothetical protein
MRRSFHVRIRSSEQEYQVCTITDLTVKARTMEHPDQALAPEPGTHQADESYGYVLLRLTQGSHAAAASAGVVFAAAASSPHILSVSSDNWRSTVRNR